MGVVLEEVGLDGAQLEGVELHDLRLHAKRRRDDVPSLFFGANFKNDPGPMVTILASPVGMRQEVGTGPEKRRHGTRARQRVGFVRHFNEEFWHLKNMCDAHSQRNTFVESVLKATKINISAPAFIQCAPHPDPSHTPCSNATACVVGSV